MPSSNASSLANKLSRDGDLLVSKTIKNQYGSITSTTGSSPTTIYTAPSGALDKGAYVHLLQMSNISASTTQVVSVTVKTSAGSAFGLLRSGSIPAGGALSVVGGNFLPLATGSIIQAHINTGTSGNVEFVLGVEEITI